MTINDKIEKIQSAARTLTGLYWRWLDEKDYEDIEEYGAVISSTLGFPVKMTKRPFGFKFDGGRADIKGSSRATLRIYTAH